MTITIPAWAKNYTNPRDWAIEKCTDGKFVVLDHELQFVVAKCDTKSEANCVLANAHSYV